MGGVERCSTIVRAHCGEKVHFQSKKKKKKKRKKRDKKLDF